MPKALSKDEIKRRKKEARENDVRRLGALAWKHFAYALKESRATFQGYVQCYTCGKTIPKEVSQAGHCFHRGRQRYKALDFDEEHIRIQCAGCNMDKNGQQDIFQQNLNNELGIEKVTHMLWRRHNEPPLTANELKEIINKYAL